MIMKMKCEDCGEIHAAGDTNADCIENLKNKIAKMEPIVRAARNLEALCDYPPHNWEDELEELYKALNPR